MDEPKPAIDDAIQPIATAFNDIVFFAVPIGGVDVPLVVLFLFVASVYFTIYLGFPALRALPQAIRITLGRESTGDHSGEVSHFQALATALSGTVGIGNIANVGVAISIGGPGVIFWMIIAGLLGTSTKLLECTLGVRFRVRHEDGSVSGGPMYFLRDGLKSIGRSTTGRVLGGFYAACLLFAVLGSGNMFQANQAYAQVVNVTGGVDGSWLADKGWLFGVAMAFIVGLVIIGGIKSIARVTEKVVPFMAILYIGLSLIVIAFNYDAIPHAIEAVFVGAFRPEGVAGGAIGVAVMGIKRAVFSNEAGIGTASIAHSAVRTDYPASEGIVALLEPLIDTVIICTISGMVIITATHGDPGLLHGELQGIQLTSRAFENTFAVAPFFVSIAALLFAFSTLLAWSYYGLKAWSYVFGKSDRGDFIYRMIFLGAIVLGCSITLKSILDLSDGMTFIIALPNLIGLILLGPVVKRELKRFADRAPVEPEDGGASAE